MKYLILAISALVLKKRETPAGSPFDMADFFRSTIHDEISAIALKLFSGIVLTSIMIFSVVQAAKAFQVYLRQFENGLVLEITSFGIIAAVCAVALYLLLKKSSLNLPVSAAVTNEISDSFDVQKLAMRFTEGIVDGLEISNQEYKNKASIPKVDIVPVPS